MNRRHMTSSQQLLKETPRNTGAMGTGNNQHEVRLPISTTPTLEELGLTKRRHLSSSQRAVVALDIEKQLAVEAKERQGERTDLFQRIEKGSEPINAAQQAAEIANTNRRQLTTENRVVSRALARLDPADRRTVRACSSALRSRLGGLSHNETLGLLAELGVFLAERMPASVSAETPNK